MIGARIALDHFASVEIAQEFVDASLVGPSECAGERSSNLTLSRKERVEFSGRSGLNLFSFDEHAFTEIQAFPLSHAPAEGKPDLAHLNGELA